MFHSASDIVRTPGWKQTTRRFLNPHKRTQLAQPVASMLCFPVVQRGKPGPGAAENKFTDEERGTKDNPSVNGDAMDSLCQQR